MAGGERFVSMEMVQANSACGPDKKQTGDQCKKCDSRVILHCRECQIQVTGCLCTEVDRFGNAEAIQRAIERWGEEEARNRLQAAGLWIPPSNN